MNETVPKVHVTLTREYCRQCREDGRTAVIAEFIIWGKLFPKEALGPRCTACANGWVDLARVDQWAVYDLRPVNKLIEDAMMQQEVLGS